MYKYTALEIMNIEEEVIVHSAKQVAKIVSGMIGEKMNEKEFFCIVTLDGRSRVIRSEVIHIGTLNQSMVHPRDVYRPAILDNAAGVVVAHNHPSGTLEASRSDIQITKRLKDVGKLVGIELLDHVIVTEAYKKTGVYYSFSEDNEL